MCKAIPEQPVTGFLSQRDLAWSINKASVELEACLLPLEMKKESPWMTSMSTPASPEEEHLSPSRLVALQYSH